MKSLNDIINEMNAIAETMLELRRMSLGLHVVGYWRAKPNLYSVLVKFNDDEL